MILFKIILKYYLKASLRLYIHILNIYFFNGFLLKKKKKKKKKKRHGLEVSVKIRWNVIVGRHASKKLTHNSQNPQQQKLWDYIYL